MFGDRYVTTQQLHVVIVGSTIIDARLSAIVVRVMQSGGVCVCEREGVRERGWIERGRRVVVIDVVQPAAIPSDLVTQILC